MNQQIIEECMSRILTEGLGLSLADPNLADTPKRVAKMYCKELFSGLAEGTNPDVTAFPNDHNYSQMILSDMIHFNSMCSHHFLPFTGNAWVLYVPDQKLIGLSKFTRLVTWHAARPQLQEQLTHDVINDLICIAEPKAAMVVMRAVHQCMSCRGVKQHGGAGMVTSAIYGEFENAAVRAEAMSLINLSMVSNSK